jgi:hypothetical protein
MKYLIRHIGVIFFRILGSDIIDQKSKKLLGRGFLWSWRGKIHLSGYEGAPLKIFFLPQQRVCYWRIDVGFTAAEEPDFSKKSGTV